jgi:hypothetical protein
MSTISMVILVVGILATVLFAAGFVRGVQNALNGFRKGSEEQFLVTDNAHWVAVGLSVLGAAVVIAAVGFIPAFVYAGPLLVLVSAAGPGLLHRGSRSPAGNDEHRIGPEPRGAQRGVIARHNRA